MSGAQRSRRRYPTRVGDLLGDVASALGLERELQRSQAIGGWDEVVRMHVPAAAGRSELLTIQPPTLVVRATSPMVAQELRLHSSDLLEAFAAAPGGSRLAELRVVVRPPSGQVD